MTSPGKTEPASTHRRASRVAASVATTAIVLLVALPAGAQTANGGFPFAAGELTGISGSTLQIEGFNGTSKVIVTNQTEYRTTETTDASSITKGACVRVSGSGDAEDGIIATTVAIQDGSAACNQTVGNSQAPPGAGNGASGPTGANRPTPPGGQGFPTGGTLPNGGTFPNGGTLPDGASPSDRPPGGFLGGRMAGKVTSVHDGTMVVTARMPSGSGTGSSSSGNSSSGSTPRLKKQKVTVTLADDVTITHSVQASRSDLVTGVCVTAQGKADSVGTVTATSVTISQPANGACGIGEFGGGPLPQ
jgi:Domain of unknown function (DUF5666)